MVHFGFLFQPVTVICMHANVVSTRNYTGWAEVAVAEYVLIVGTILLDATVITADSITIETSPSQSLIVKHVDVSFFFFCEVYITNF